MPGPATANAWMDNAVRWLCVASRVLLLTVLVPPDRAGAGKSSCPLLSDSKGGRLGIIALHLMLVAVAYTLNARRAPFTGTIERVALTSLHVAMLSIAAQIAYSCFTAWALVPMVVEFFNLGIKEVAKIKVQLQELVPPAPTAPEGKSSSGDRLLRKAMATAKQSAGGNAAEQEQQPAAPVRSEEKAAAVASELDELTAFLSGKPGVQQLRPVGEPTPIPDTTASAAAPSSAGDRFDAELPPFSQVGSNVSEGSAATTVEKASAAAPVGLDATDKTAPPPVQLLLDEDAVVSEARGEREKVGAGAASGVDEEELVARRSPRPPLTG